MPTSKTNWSDIVDSVVKKKAIYPTEDEAEKLNEIYDRSFLENIILGIEDVAASVAKTAGEFTEKKIQQYTGDTVSEKGAVEQAAIEHIEERKKEKELLSKFDEDVSFVREVSSVIPEVAALWRQGIRAGSGETMATWGGTEYGVQKLQGKDNLEATESALLVGTIGEAVSKGSRALNKAYEEGLEEAEKQAGGGKIQESDMFDETPMQRAEDNLKYFSEEEVTSITGKDAEQRAFEAEMRQEGLMEVEQRGVRSDKETLLDKEAKDIQAKFDKLDEDPEGYIIEVNSDLFSGIDKLDAYEMLKAKPELRDMLRQDIEKELFERANKIDFIKRGDDRIEIGAKSDLYDELPDSTKAEELATQVQANRAKKKAEAEKVKLEAESKQVHLGEAKIQLNKALEKLNKAVGIDDTKIATFELEEALRVLEPKSNLTKAIKEQKLKDVDVEFEGSKVGRGADKSFDTISETGETMSTKDVAARDAQIGIGVKSKPFTKQQLEKIEKQREHNRIAHEEFLEKNKDKLNKKYDNEADRIEYEKLVEQDKKYNDTDRALAKDIRKVDKTYEVSTAGDKRFSALNARLKDGRTIEEAYQLDVKGYRNESKDWRYGKGKPPKDKSKNMQEEYDKLWKQFLEENPKLKSEIKRKIDDGYRLTDKFSRDGTVNQADTITRLIKEEEKLFVKKNDIMNARVIATEADEIWKKLGKYEEHIKHEQVRADELERILKGRSKANIDNGISDIKSKNIERQRGFGRLAEQISKITKMLGITDNSLQVAEFSYGGDTVGISGFTGKITSPTKKEFIESVSSNLREPFKKLVDSVPYIKVYNVGGSNFGLLHTGGSAGAFYHNRSGKMFFSSAKKANTDATKIHEVIHAASYNALRNSEEFRNTAKMAKEELDKYISDNNIKLKKEDKYYQTDSIGNYDEFISEAFSNPRIIEILNKIPSKKKSSIVKTIFDEIVEGVLDFVGIKANKGSILRELSESFDTAVKKFGNEMAEGKAIVAKEINSVDNFSNWMSDVLDTKSAKSFREIHNASKLAFDSASRFKTVVVDQVYEVTKHMPNKGKQFREQLHRHLLETDYNSIKEFGNREAANRFFNSNRNLYNKAKKEIDLLAKSMKDSKHMNDVDWRGNGFAIAKKLDIDVAQADTIEKLASIRAMDDADWRFVEQFKDTDAFKLAMDLMRTRDELSADLFKDNPYNRIKGYSTEIFNNLPNEFTYKRGAIPPEMQTKIKGRTETRPKGMSDKAFEDYAQLEGMGLVLDSVGNPKLARRVADDIYKTYTLGRSRDFGEVIGETLGVSVRKQNINNHFMHKMSDVLSRDNGLFNGTGDKFVRLTDDEIAMLPKQLRPLIQTINKDAKGMLLGNMEVHIKTNKQAFINSQLLLKDLVRGLKENVVLKNPVSYVNNFLFNYAIGLQNGISPAKMFKYQTEAITQYKQMRTLQDSMIKMIVEGKKGTEGYNKLVEQIKSLDLYKMHQDGLSFSVLSDITSAPSYSNRMSDKIIKGVTESLFGKETADKLGEIASEIYLSPNARSGKFLLDTFTKIDVSGRYGIAKDAISKGATLKEAVNKSNGIFGDLDKLSPEWVQAISEFGGIHFGNWFYRVSGGLSTNVYNNAGKAVALGVGLYVAEDMFGKRTESFNPMLTIINSPLDMMMMSPYLNISSIPVEPAIYKKIGTGEPDKLIMSDSF